MKAAAAAFWPNKTGPADGFLKNLKPPLYLPPIPIQRPSIETDNNQSIHRKKARLYLFFLVLFLNPSSSLYKFTKPHSIFSTLTQKHTPYSFLT
jgi:hypothetical protein